MVQRHALVGKISDYQTLAADLIVISGIGAHAGAGRAGFAEGDSGRDCRIVERAVAIVV